MFKELWRIAGWTATIAGLIVIFIEVKDPNTQIILTVLGLIYAGVRGALLAIYVFIVEASRVVDAEFAMIKAEVRGYTYDPTPNTATVKGMRETRRLGTTGFIFLGIFEVICLLNLFRLIF